VIKLQITDTKLQANYKFLMLNIQKREWGYFVLRYCLYLVSCILYLVSCIFNISSILAKYGCYGNITGLISEIIFMAKMCPICEKGSQVGGGYSNRVRATQFNPIGKRRRQPNLQWATKENGSRLKICTRCLKANKHLAK